MNTKNKIYIGFFDALHKGHLRILKDKNIKILTFKDIPSKSYAIYPLQKRIEDLNNIGFNLIDVYDIQKNNLNAKEFIEQYLIKNNFEQIIVGSDFKLGKDQLNVKELKKLIDTKVVVRTKTSTTILKKYLQNGDIDNFNKKAIFNYSIKGKVIKGEQLGRKLGYNTANIETNYNKYLKNGVYLTKTFHNGEEYFGLTFIGTSKTFDNKIFSIENHIFNFNKDIYGEEIKIEFIKFMDEVKKFDNINELKKHINNLVEKSKKCIK